MQHVAPGVLLADTGGPPGWLWFVALFAFALVFVGAYVYRHFRGKALAAYAHGRGWTYTRRQDEWARRDLGWPSSIGRAHQAHHVLAGGYDGHHAVVFEHHWVTGSGDDRRNHRATVCTLGLPRSVSKLAVSRENAFTRVGRALGIRDIELESDAFNREFRVTGDDPRFAYDVLHPRFMEWLLHADAPGFTLVADRVVLAHGGGLDETMIDHDLSYLVAVIAQIPPRLLHR